MNSWNRCCSQVYSENGVRIPQRETLGISHTLLCVLHGIIPSKAFDKSIHDHLYPLFYRNRKPLFLQNVRSSDFAQMMKSVDYENVQNQMLSQAYEVNISYLPVLGQLMEIFNVKTQCIKQVEERKDLSEKFVHRFDLLQEGGDV